MDKVKFRIIHQAVVICPKCHELIVAAIGEDNSAFGIEVKCSACGNVFILAERID